MIAVEALLPNSGIRNMIREGKTHQIPAQMQTGQKETEMFTMDQSLAMLVKNGLIEEKEGRRRSVDITDFQAALR